MEPTARASVATRMANSTCVLRGEVALTEDQMREVVPSIFADVKHASRSERYTCIPTIEVLRGLRREGFEPFMVAQGRCRIEGKAAYTRHMVRLRHVRDIENSARGEVNEVILINSHDGASSYRVLAGVFRFVCCNDLVVGGVTQEIRVPHKGHVHSEVIEAAVAVLADFEAVDASTEAMKAIELRPEEERLFANSALMLRYGERGEGRTPAPITIEQLMRPRRVEDVGHSLWVNFQRVQENATRGGQVGRTASGKRFRTREVASIDRGVRLNRALWDLAEEMRCLKG